MHVSRDTCYICGRLDARRSTRLDRRIGAALDGVWSQRGLSSRALQRILPFRNTHLPTILALRRLCPSERLVQLAAPDVPVFQMWCKAPDS